MRHLHQCRHTSTSTRPARLDRLIRGIWLDPRVFRRGALDDVAALVARRQSPIAPPRLVAEAIDRLRKFVEGPLGRQIAASNDVHRDIPWSIAWPEGSPSSTVIEGALDLAYRDKDGAWTLVHVADATGPDAPARLRLALSARLAPRLGLGPIARTWLLAHGEAGVRGKTCR